MDDAARAAEAFFAAAPSPVSEATVSTVREFVGRVQGVGRPLAVVTAGGTTVPLEARTVRFIDNFSTGNRGAALAEHLLESGYSVLFVHRRSCAFPFARAAAAALAADPVGFLADGAAAGATAVVEAARRGGALLGDGDRFLAVGFTTIFEYLGLLRASCEATGPLRAKTLLVCAAAVSDFYAADLPEHKIQSRNIRGVTLNLEPVPKMLGLLREWAGHAEACIVGFKLETDADLLKRKAQKSLEAYGMDAVVANLLESYKTKATIYGRDGAAADVGGEGGGPSVDGAIAAELVRVHRAKGAPPPPPPPPVTSACVVTTHDLVDEANVSRCIDLLLEADDGGDACLDRGIAAGVQEAYVPPDACGVPSWRKVVGEWGDDYGPVERGGALWFAPPGGESEDVPSKHGPRVLFLHGGVHCYYSAKSYAPLASRLAALCRMPVLVPDFRLAPSHKFPKALDDAASALDWLRTHRVDEAGALIPDAASHVFLAGDSSVGGLAVAVALRESHCARVDGVVAFSPWLDLTCEGASYETRKFDERTKTGDPVFNSGDAETERNETREMAEAYLGGADARDPSASPRFASPELLRGLPPTCLVSGDADVILDDAVTFFERAKAAGAKHVRLDVWPRLWHDFVMYTEGRKRVIQRRFNVGVLEAMSEKKASTL